MVALRYSSEHICKDSRIHAEINWEIHSKMENKRDIKRDQCQDTSLGKDKGKQYLGNNQFFLKTMKSQA